MARMLSRVFALGVLLVAMAVVASATNTTVVAKECGTDKIPSGSQFTGHLGLLLTQLAENAPYNNPQPGYYFKTRTGGQYDPAFGQASCLKSISAADCETCLTKLRDDIWGQCNNALYAYVEYGDCSIKYSNKYF